MFVTQIYLHLTNGIKTIASSYKGIGQAGNTLLILKIDYFTLALIQINRMQYLTIDARAR